MTEESLDPRIGESGIGDPNIAAARLEAALARIATQAAQPRHRATDAANGSSPAFIGERLDIMIGRLKTALGKPD